MHIESEDFIEQSADDVYPLVRDRMTELLPYLPNVNRVTQLESRRLNEHEVEIVNRWEAKSQLPAMAAKFLPNDLFTWTDHAHWYDNEYHVKYRIEGYGYQGTGVNSFKPEGTGTRIHIMNDIEIDPKAFKIPKLIFNKVFPLVEDAVKRALEPNVTALSGAVRKYFEAQG